MTQEPGPVAEEAAKLLEALGAWARAAAGSGAGDGMGGGWSAEDLRSTIGRLAEHADASISDGSPACRLCPVCQVIAVLRHARPETFAHLLDASAALSAAARSLLEHSGESRSGRAAGVQKIDLDPPGSAAGSA